MNIPPKTEFKSCKIMLTAQSWDAVYPMMWPDGWPAAPALNIAFGTEAASDPLGLGLWVAHKGKYKTKEGIRTLEGYFLLRWEFIQGVLFLDTPDEPLKEEPVQRLGFKGGQNKNPA